MCVWLTRRRVARGGGVGRVCLCGAARGKCETAKVHGWGTHVRAAPQSTHSGPYVLNVHAMPRAACMHVHAPRGGYVAGGCGGVHGRQTGARSTRARGPSAPDPVQGVFLTYTHACVPHTHMCSSHTHMCSSGFLRPSRCRGGGGGRALTPTSVRRSARPPEALAPPAPGLQAGRCVHPAVHATRLHDHTLAQQTPAELPRVLAGICLENESAVQHHLCEKQRQGFPAVQPVVAEMTGWLAWGLACQAEGAARSAHTPAGAC
jgi:hypothetical protein